MDTDGDETESDDMVALRFVVTDASYPFVGASEHGRMDLERMLPREAGRYAEFFSVVGVAPDRIVDLASEDDRVEATLIDRHDYGGLVEFTVAGSCPVRDLAELGAIPQAAGGEDGEGWIEAEVPPGRDAGRVVDQFLERHPTIELSSKHTQSALTPLFSPQELRRAVDQRLTDRQREVLCNAYEAGFYDQPRGVTAGTVAAELDISGATFSQHRRAAERKLVSFIVADQLSAK